MCILGVPGICSKGLLLEFSSRLQVKIPAMSAQEFGPPVGADEYYCTMQPWRHQAL